MLEILAPCGGYESLVAAVNSGADAVYLGETTFSARRNAENFTPEQLREAVKLCHLSGVKVHVALNTLVFDTELDKLEKTVEMIADCGIDAVIVQDFGVARTIKKIADIPLHASTQMTITSPSGAEMAKEAGFSRVVLAREMSLREIERVVKSVDIETEIFVHGAICVCLSGQCYMSAVLGGRSGNRGLCAQPCRLNFTCGKRENVLSLKDLSLVSHLQEIEKTGVTSVKIEGRMKRPEYVAAAVTACKRALRGEIPDMENLRAVFSRSGFTDSYYSGSFEKMQGVRTKEDVVAAPKAINELKQLYKDVYKRYKADISVEIHENKPSVCVAECNGVKVSTEGEIPQKAINKPSTAEDISARMSKLGGTVFEVGRVSCNIDQGLILSASAVNGLRRDVIEKLSEKIIEKNKPQYKA